ncbi:mitochondrial fission 1 protein isoform X2 [Hermetia illucens]|uniref:mitochondrial fission 1 protein isoform X2 n=1 Tax=Hermetia illucens TaxID=343691 RepID=UPI0018CC2244|nr:mitochondrial fission 1 protein isoform X2 [Hermetia illucens]
MEELLSEVVPQQDLEKFEKKYHQELDQQSVSHRTQFEYAWCLVRSSYAPDIQKGILLLEDLMTRDADGKRDYIYYLAIGNARIKQYSLAMKFCKAFLQIEPNNQQVISLEQYVKDKLEKESLKGIAVAGGAALALGGLIGLGIALAKKIV